MKPVIHIKREPGHRFRYLWLKYVVGVNLGQHCAKSLRGNYSVRVDPRGSEIIAPLDEFAADVFYLCGVSVPYDWANNFHLAFERADGETFTVERNGLTVEVTNGREIPIRSDYTSTPHSRLAAFNTCRNWLFANQNQERFNR
jgi:hypothetical protein